MQNAEPEILSGHFPFREDNCMQNIAPEAQAAVETKVYGQEFRGNKVFTDASPLFTEISAKHILLPLVLR